MKKSSRMIKGENVQKHAQSRSRFLLAILLLLFIGMNMSGKTAKASSAFVSVTTQNPNPQKGETVYVLITVSSGDSIGGFEGYFTYDNRVLRFETGGSVISGNDDSFRVSDINRSSPSKQIKYAVKFTARAKGDTVIRLRRPYNVFLEGDDHTKMSVSYDNLRITVGTGEKTDNNSSSSPLPQQAENMTSTPLPSAAAETPVPQETDSPMPEATPKKKKKKTNTTLQIDDIDGIRLVRKGGRRYLAGNVQVELTELPEDSMIPSGFEKRQITIEGTAVTAYLYAGDTDSSIVLVYGTEGEEEEFYLLDQKEKRLYRYEKVKAWYDNAWGRRSEKDEEYEQNELRLKCIIGIVAAFCGILLLITIMAVNSGRHWKREYRILEHEILMTEEQEEENHIPKEMPNEIEEITEEKTEEVKEEIEKEDENSYKMLYDEDLKDTTMEELLAIAKSKHHNK